jgi:hypothetical protein
VSKSEAFNSPERERFRACQNVSLSELVENWDFQHVPKSCSKLAENASLSGRVGK